MPSASTRGREPRNQTSEDRHSCRSDRRSCGESPSGTLFLKPNQPGPDSSLQSSSASARDNLSVPPSKKDTASRLKSSGFAVLALGVVLGAYSWSIWGSPAFGMMADQAYHVAFAQEFDRSWRDGDLPPRWAAGANGGRGSLGFVVYPPLFAFVTAVWLWLGMTPQDALRMAVLLAAAGAFAATCYLARGWLSRERSLLAATIVLLLPGVTFVALGRGMFPNFAVLGWVALLLGAGQRALLGRRVHLNLVLMTFAAAGAILTHTLTAYLLALLLLVVSPLIARSVGLRGIAWGALPALGAALLTCWFWLPSFHAGSYARVDYLTFSHPYLNSVFGGGDGTAGDAVFSQDWQFLNDLGRYIITAQSLVALLVVLALMRPRGRRQSEVVAKSEHPTTDVLFLRALPYVAGFAMLAAMEPVARLLLYMPRFESVQFAWRWQLLVALWCGVGLASLPRHRKSALPGAFAALAVLFFLPLISPSSVLPSDQQSDLSRAVTRSELDEMESVDRAAYAGNLLELRPNEMDSRFYLPGQFGRAEVIRGEADIEARVLRVSQREYSVTAESDSTVRLLTYYAPGWSAELDGETVSMRMDRETGLQLVDIPAGPHRLLVEYAVPWPW